MAITGLMLLGFLIAHLIGNLQIFLGPDAINTYAEKLRSMPEVLFVMRTGLLLVFILHIVTAILLSHASKKARPQAYYKKNYVEATYSSRVMMISGCLILIYVLYHLSHFTWGVAHPETFHYVDVEGRHNVYAMITKSFVNPYIAFGYVFFMAVLCFHLMHALKAVPQTLGLCQENQIKFFEIMGNGLAIALFIGYSAIPVAIQFNLIP